MASAAPGRGPAVNGTGASKMSRMQAMQAQFQQKQMAEKETKLLAMLDSQQQKLIQQTNGFLNKYNNNPAVAPPAGPAQGKVRQMFEERRKGGSISATVPSNPAKGIDKSYPLDPIVTPPLPQSKTRLSGNATTGHGPAAAPVRKTPTPTPIPTPISRPTNLGSSKKPQPTPSATPTSTHTSSSKPPSPFVRTPTSNPPSRASGASGASMSRSSASSSASSNQSRSPTHTGYPPVANTTKYSEYASELDKREQTLSNKLRGIDISSSSATSLKKTPSPKPVPNANNYASTVKTMPSAPMAVKSAKKTPPRPKGSPPPGLEACKNCGRFFAPDRIAKHENVCAKVSKKKRKVFDPTKMRMQGTEAEPYIRIVSAKPKVPPKSQAKKKADWRKQHQEFIATIRAAKEYQNHVAKGGNPNDLPPPPPTDTSDYIQCPHCNRKFNEAAASRHIPKCASIKSNKR